MMPRKDMVLASVMARVLLKLNDQHCRLAVRLASDARALTFAYMHIHERVLAIAKRQTKSRI